MTPYRTSAGDHADSLARTREKIAATAYTSAGVLAFAAAVSAAEGPAGLPRAAALALAGAAAAGYGTTLRRGGAAEIRHRKGHEGEARTRTLVGALAAEGWHGLHDRVAPRGGNIDHLMIPPCGSLVVVIDSKRWHARRTATTDTRGTHLYCGHEDRTEQVRTLCRLSDQVGRQLSAVPVVPVLAVHGSPVRPDGQTTVRTAPAAGPVSVLGPGSLLTYLRRLPGDRPDPAKAAALARRVRTLFPSCT